MLSTKSLPKVILTENQFKVIKDKYLRNAATVEEWLYGVAHNIALAELLHRPEWHGAIFNGINKEVFKTEDSITFLFHTGLAEAGQREANFQALVANLETLYKNNAAATSLVDSAAIAFYKLMASWSFLPNSPTLMNAGRELQQLSACYVLPVPDSMEGITKALSAQSLIQKSGGGCVKKGTLVATKKGLKKIEDVTTADVVYSLNPVDGKTYPAKVRQTHIYQVPEAYEVTGLGGVNATVSPWHPFMVFDGLNITEKRADEMKVGDQLILPNASAPKEKDARLSWLVGFFIGDGCLNKIGKSVSFSVATEVEQQAVNAALQKLTKKIYRVDTSGTVPTITVQNNVGVAFFKKYFTPGKKSHTVTIPADFQTPATIAGLLDADGWQDGKSIYLETASQQLADQVAALLNLWGMKTRRSSWVSKPTTGKKVQIKVATTMHVVKISNQSSLLKFKQLIAPHLVRLQFPKISWASSPIKLSPKVAHVGDGTSHYYSWKNGKTGLSTSTALRWVTDPKIKEVLSHLVPVTSVRKVAGGEFRDLTVAKYETYAAGNQGLIFIHNTGFAFSRLRSKGALVKKTSGVASGALSFMQLFDKLTDVVKQGGTRRGANMGILHYTHPEILDFIKMKQSPGVMENFNISVALDSNFFTAVERNEEYNLVDPKTQTVVSKVNAKEVFDAMLEQAWKTGDPGFVVIDRINSSGSNPTPALGQIESTNPCLVGESLVPTEKGLRRLDSLVVGEKVLTKKGLLPITKFHRNGVKPVFKITTEDGFELTATANHKLYTPSGELIEVAKLQPGDILQLQSGGHFSEDYSFPVDPAPYNAMKATNNRVYKEIDLPKQWTVEFAEFLGFITGDGYTSKNIVGMALGKDEKELVGAFKGPVDGRTNFKSKNWSGQGSSHFTTWSSKGFVEFIKALGWKEGSKNKTIPEAVLTAPKDIQAAFLRGLFSADRSVLETGTSTRVISLWTNSHQLAHLTQLVLLQFGIHAKKHKNSGSVDSWSIYIGAKDKLIFEKEINFLLERKRKRLAEINAKETYERKNRFTAKVKSITPAGEAEVFDYTEPQTLDLFANAFYTLDCGEQPLLPWEPCNLGSINLSNFVTSGKFDLTNLKEAVHTAVRFLDDVIDVNNYPLPEIERLAKGNRRIGLGVMGWGEALVKIGIPYDSEEALKKAREVMEFINVEALNASIELAKTRGVFPNWKNSIYDPAGDHYRGVHILPRHCARTTIAPTGTIAIAAGLQGSGIEPFFAIAYTRYNAKALEALKKGQQPAAGDVFFEVNPLFKEVAAANNFFGLSEKVLWQKINDNHKAVRGIAEIPEHIQAIFPVAHDVVVDMHVQTQAAFQAFTDNGVSKTINMPNNATVEDIRKAYLSAYAAGCKGITIYRDGSKTQQVLNLAPASSAPAASPKTKRRDPSKAFGASSEYYQIQTGYGPLHVHINYDEFGPYQVFANIPPLGTEIAALTSVMGILLSKYLAEGGDPLRILKHLNSVSGDRTIGFGPKRVNSIAHGIAIAMTQHLKKTGWIEGESIKRIEVASTTDAARCDKCYSSNVSFESGCSGPTCHDCGFSKCS